jgi:hypothetical protein
LVERTASLGVGGSEAGSTRNKSFYNPIQGCKDLTTIHEAFQFLMKKYVEEAQGKKEERRNIFLSIAQIKANHVKKRTSNVDINVDQQDINMLAVKNISRPSSRYRCHFKQD